MRVIACLLLIGFLVSLNPSSIKTASAIIPEVRNVTVYTVDSSTYLNVTVYHTIEIPSHYVNTIEVSFNGNTTNMTIGIQTLAPGSTFRVQYDAGPVSGTPTATVRAYCTFNGWSLTNWTGPIPEFSSFLMLPFFLITTFLTGMICRRKRS